MGIVGRHAELDRCEESWNPLFALVGDVLPDALLNEVHASLEFDDSNCDAIHIDDEVESLLRVLDDGHLFGNVEVFVVGGYPVDELDVNRCGTRFWFDRHAVFQ